MHPGSLDVPDIYKEVAGRRIDESQVDSTQGEFGYSNAASLFGTIISWTASVTDGSGNTAEVDCQTEIVKPPKNSKKSSKK